MFSKKFLKKFRNEIESLTYKDGETSKEFSDRVFPMQDYSKLIYIIDNEFVNIASAKKPERALSDLDIYLMIYKKIPDELLGMYVVAGMQRVTWCVNEVVRSEQQMLEKLLIDKKIKPYAEA